MVAEGKRNDRELTEAADAGKRGVANTHKVNRSAARGSLQRMDRRSWLMQSPD